MSTFFRSLHPNDTVDWGSVRAYLADNAANAPSMGSPLGDLARWVRTNRALVDAGVQAAAGLEGIILELIPDRNGVKAQWAEGLHELGNIVNSWLDQAPLDPNTRADLRTVAPAATVAGLSALHANGEARALTRSLDELVPRGRIPSIRGGAFNEWFNGLTSDEFSTVWAQPSFRRAIEARIRQPGGLHEWLRVSQTDTFKSWGVTMEQIQSMRTPISDLNGIWTHGGAGSTIAHNEIIGMVHASSSFSQYRVVLQAWADTRLTGGRAALPPGLRD